MNPVVVPLTAELVQLILQIQQIKSSNDPAVVDAIWKGIGQQVATDVKAFDAASAGTSTAASPAAPAA